jgi:hypothetical protein
VRKCFEPINNQQLLSPLKDTLKKLSLSKVLDLKWFDFFLVSQEIFTKTLLGKKERMVSACGVKR